MKVTAEQAYVKAYARVMQSIRDLENKIHDMPAPEGETKIDWGHVGDMNRILIAITEI
jgi:hypothetical protein